MITMDYRKQIPVIRNCDVAVLGGGPAGIGAAVAAAKEGMQTVLVERFGFFGGMATAGYVDPMSEFSYNGNFVSGGIPMEFANRLIAAGGGQMEPPRCNLSFNPEIYKLVASKMLAEYGVERMMNTVLIDAIMEENAAEAANENKETGHLEKEQEKIDPKRIRAVVVANKSGIGAVEAKMFIDATGDADLCAMAGVEMLPHDRPLQPGSLCFILGGVDTTTERMHIIHQKNHRFNHQATFVREPLLKLREEGVNVPQFGGPWLNTTLEEGCITVNMTRAAMDATDPKSYQAAEEKMREDIFTLVALMKEHVEEFKNSYIVSIAPVAGIRETRRIHGVHVLTGQEYVETVHFTDAIARACHPVDIHLPDGEGQQLTFPKDAGYIPYRSLITPEYENLLAAGRCISADNDAFAAIRVQAPCMETGQAAGFAAAQAVRDGVSVQNVDTEKLVERVRKEGAVI